MDISTIRNEPGLLIALGAALTQGVLLYLLHTAIDHKVWPATRVDALTALYSVAVFVPLTIELLSEHGQKKLFWQAVIGMGVMYALLGWHFGANVAVSTPQAVVASDDAFIYGLTAGVLWVLFVPFLRCRLANDRWRCEYPQLFAAAWQNVLMLAEAVAFTGALWLLLGLWQQLFVMLGYRVFRNLFDEPAFIYPVTTVTFGAALYLSGSIERLVSVIREQILGLLKWLAPVAALILALFTPTLLFKLPNLILHGERTIEAVWLLWILVLTVLLLNAGYQNGMAEKPYPKFLQLALRAVVPAMVVVAATALYALVVRIVEYGITVERVFGLVVAIVASAYSVGYAGAAMRRGPWLKGIERVNVMVALGLMVILVVMLTPIGSPYRLAANSQYQRLLASSDSVRLDAMKYLRFESGQYGIGILQRIVAGTASQALKDEARRMLAADNPWDATKLVRGDALVAQLVIFPRGQALEPELMKRVTDLLREARTARNLKDPVPWAVLTDLDGDSVNECVLIYDVYMHFFAKRAGVWLPVSEQRDEVNREEKIRTSMRAALESGDFGPHARRWNDLRIGDRVLRLPLPNENMSVQLD